MTKVQLQDTTLSPDKLIYDFATTGSPQISPDGKTILYTLSTPNREKQKVESKLYFCDIDGGNAREAIADLDSSYAGKWSPDGQSIAYLSKEDKLTSVRVRNIQRQEDKVIAQYSEITEHLVFSPDSTQLSYVTYVDLDRYSTAASADFVPPRVITRLDYKQDNRGLLNNKRTQIFVANLASGEVKQLSKSFDDLEHPQWSPDGKSIVAHVLRLNGCISLLSIITVATGAIKYVGAKRAFITTWSWSPSGKEILFTSGDDFADQPDFYLYDLKSEKITRLTDNLAFHVDGGFRTVFPPSQPFFIDDETALVHAIEKGASLLATINIKTKQVNVVSRFQSVKAGLSGDTAGKYFVQAHSDLSSVGEISVFDLKQKEEQIITRQTQIFKDKFGWAEPSFEKFTINRKGFDIDAWLLKPANFNPNKKYPLILDVHGGPHGYYGFGFNAIQQCLASNEFLVLYSNPRGSSSYGRDFARAVVADWGGEDEQDLFAVLDEACKLPFVDTDRLGLWGYSYGGYMTAWIIGRHHRFKAAVCGAPCFDLESMFGTSDIGHVFCDLEYSGKPYHSRKWYEEHSPSTHAHNTKTPTLIVHGEADERTPIGQSEQMFCTLKSAGCDVEFVRYPGCSHIFLRGGHSEYRKDFIERILQWFKKHLA
jgi:dipeptidyl aminopeptidase/acylaminoacyl peptidase